MRAPLVAGRTRPGDSPGRELAAGLATAAVVAQFLFAPATLAIAVALMAVGRTSRWRPPWLLLPALAGLGWLLANGAAVTAFAAFPRRLSVHVGHQLPSALLFGSAEAALVLWLVWYPLPWRPGLVAVLRRRASARALCAGHTVAPDGFALGLVTGTGKPVSVTWAEAERGVLITGQNERGQAVRRRSVALVSRGAAQVVRDLIGVLESLRDHDLRADCLACISGSEQLEPACLDRLLELGQATGTALLFSSASEACAAAMAPRAQVVVADGAITGNLATQLASQVTTEGREWAIAAQSGAAARQRRPNGVPVIAANLGAQRPGEFTMLARRASNRARAGRPCVLPNCLLVPVDVTP